jgi:aspartyl-tRNA(Asn)/glutamyl-tRNA(Gln) amidotransferase subunit C
MSAPTEPSATANAPRLPGRSTSSMRNRYDGTRPLLHSAAHTAFPQRGAPAKVTGEGAASRALGRERAASFTFAAGARLGFSLVSQISRDEVAHLAKLARLALTDTELDSFAGQLDAILTHVSQIQAVDVTGVEATDNPLIDVLEDVNVTRPDETRPCLTQEQALAAAPAAVDGRFAVPQILGDSE